MAKSPNLAQWAKRYVELFNFALVPIEPGQKAPKGNAWNQPGGYFIDAEQATTFWRSQPPFAGGDAVPSATGTVGVVYGGERAELDRAFAQRIVRIAQEGDEGLIALAACQGYARSVSILE